MEKKLFYAVIVLAILVGVAGWFLPRLSQPQDSGQGDFAGAAGDVDRIHKVHQIAITAATNTPAAILNPSGGRDRFISKAYCWGIGATTDQALLNGEQSTNLSKLSIATSTSQYATTTGVNYIAQDVTFYGFTASSTVTGGFYSTSTAANGSAAGNLNLWKAGSYLLFRIGSLVSTTSASVSGYCGAEYYTQM